MHVPEPKKLSYNARCREATLLIDKLIKAKASVSVIKLSCLREYGLGGLFVDKYLKLLDHAGYITLYGGEIEYDKV